MRLKDATSTLLQRVPAFATARSSDESFMSHDDDSPYLVYGDFGLFLLQHIKSTREQSGNEELLQQSFGLLDEMLTSPDPEVVNLAQVGVIETLADLPDALDVASSYLREGAEIMFETRMHDE